jgi:hypothetical protein
MKKIKLIICILYFGHVQEIAQDKLIYAKLYTGNDFFLEGNSPLVNDINTLGNKIYLIAIVYTPKKNERKLNFGYEINFLGNSQGVGYTSKNSYSYILSNIYASMPITYDLALLKKIIKGLLLRLVLYLTLF